MPRRLPAVALLVAVVWPVAGARADARLDARRIVVDTSAGRAVVARDPFRLTVRDAAGRIVLREVAPPRRPVRSALPPTDDPEPFGVERKPDRAVAAPLSFLVGSRRLEQWTGVFWAGNVLFARRQGTWFAARHVVRVTRRGGGVRLVLATSDPGGRRLVVELGPDRSGAVRLRARPVPARGVVAMADAYDSPAGEAFHGFGGRHWGVDQRGRTLVTWTAQENIGGRATIASSALLPGLTDRGTRFTLDQLGGLVVDPLPGGRAHYLVPGGPSAAYYPQAQFTSSRGYGFLLNRPELSRFRMAAGGARRWLVDVDARRLDATIVPAPDERRAVPGLTAITGRHRLPPAWALEPMLSRTLRIDGSEDGAAYVAKVRADLAEIERRRPPLGAYAFEGWARLPEPFVRATIARLHRLGLRAVLYVRAYVSDDVLRSQPAGDVATALRRGLVATDAAGKPYAFDANGAPGWVLDPTNPATRRWWRARLAHMLALGADGFMQDFGEQVLEGMRFHDGSTGATMHNRLPVLLHRLSRRYLDAVRPRTWFFTRAGFSGRPGSAAVEMGTFPGDETVEWGAASGLASQTPDMLNRAVGGAFGFTTDIGGYVDLLTGPPDAELFTRWSEWAALSPYFRVHNTAYAGVRMPWSYGEPTYRRWLAAARLHARAVGLVRRLWRAGRRTGIPPTRPLWLADPRSPLGRRVDDEWLLGPDLLVAPVVREGASARDVVLPSGCWRRPGGGAPLHGPGRTRVAAPLGRLPYFVRCGTRPLS